MLVYQKLSRLIHTYKSKDGDTIQQDHYLNQIHALLNSHVNPHFHLEGCIGVCIFATTDKKLVLYGPRGAYKVHVTPSLLDGIEIKMDGSVGKSKDLEEYLRNKYRQVLSAPVGMFYPGRCRKP